jgi:hypothetical protein
MIVEERAYGVLRPDAAVPEATSGSGGGTSDLVPPFADPHGTLQLAVQMLHGLDPGQTPEGKLDGGDANEGGLGLDEVFEILGCRHRPVARS